MRDRQLAIVNYGSYWTVQTFWHDGREYRLITEVRVRALSNLLKCVDKCSREWDKSGSSYSIRVN